MEGKHNISQYRSRLDKTLASHDLENENTLKSLVRHQMLRSSQCEAEEYIDNVVEKRTNDVSNLLSMLRSASGSDTVGSKANEAPHGGWKLKQDTQEYRVMYREGPVGTPFHTLLVEGYIDGPVDHCLCVSWESGLYKKWWPHFNVPTFKVVSSECVKRVRIGEDISLVRMKVSWPLSAREALIHFVEFEYLQDDLIIVLLNSISDLESIERSTHGFTRDGIPDVQNVVRIDVVGGYALQKVTADRSYFRTIANMDIKLDFVPPAFINFISRQLIGSGFRLYQKEVVSVSKHDADFGNSLKEPLYTRIRESLYSDNMSKGPLEPLNLESDAPVPPEEILVAIIQPEGINVDEEILSDRHAKNSTTEAAVLIDQKAISEIEEIEESEDIEEESTYETPTNEVVEKCRINNEKNVTISLEVEEALGTLEKIISIFREYGFGPQTWHRPGFSDKAFTTLRKDAAKDRRPLESQISLNVGACAEEPLNKSTERTSHEPGNSSFDHGSRHAGNIFSTKDAKDNRIVPASMEEDIPSPSETCRSSFSFSKNKALEATVFEKITNGELVNSDSNGIDENTYTKRKNKKLRFCCLHFTSGRLVS